MLCRVQDLYGFGLTLARLMLRGDFEEVLPAQEYPPGTRQFMGFRTAEMSRYIEHFEHRVRSQTTSRSAVA